MTVQDAVKVLERKGASYIRYAPPLGKWRVEMDGWAGYFSDEELISEAITIELAEKDAEVERLKKALDSLLQTVDEATGELELRVNNGKAQFAVLTCDDPEEPTSTWWMTIGRPVGVPELARYLDKVSDLEAIWLLSEAERDGSAE